MYHILELAVVFLFLVKMLLVKMLLVYSMYLVYLIIVVFIDLIDLASIESEKLSFKIYSRQSNNITTNDILLAVVKKKNSRTGILLNQVGLSYSIIRNKIIDNQHPFGLRSFKKIEKSIISRINTIDGKSAQCDHPNPV